MRLRLLRFSVSFLAAILAAAAVADDRLKYQKRGNRSEGTRDQLVAGFHVDLLSVRVNFDELIGKLGERLRLRFYLPEAVPAHITVREVENRYYYWLDDVQPKTPWQKGFGNEFDWPTNEVMAQLGDLTVNDLGTLVRLGSKEPSSKERVAPAILYQSKLPAQIQAYEFTFKLREDSNITVQVLNEQDKQAVFNKTLDRQIGGEPLRIEWNAAQAPAGSYRLVLSGYVRSTNEKVYQEVSFYHQPTVK